MDVLVTGATGKVGNAVARALVARGDAVRVLARDPAAARRVLPDAVRVIRGDVTDEPTLPPALEGSELVFNSMGLPEQWVPDDEVFHRVNAVGTESLVSAAAAAGVRRFVHTSTHDVFHAEPGASFDESHVADYPKGTAYERSKQEAERLALGARGDMELVIVNPSGVYGPGPGASVSFDEQLFRPLVRGRLPALTPGGTGLVFAEGVASGHLLAAEKGADGQRYILCDTHASLRELAETTVRVAGRGRVPPVLPVPLARAVAAASEGLSRLTRRPPLVSRGQLHYLLWNARPDSSKAQRDLGWRPTPLEEGLAKTVAALDV